ncbi:MAG: hypothetical protein EBR82_61905 [Caulobacteraceae bacterium]|nr:hypothetical protein [Caulobacteraceae bacterium]
MGGHDPIIPTRAAVLPVPGTDQTVHVWTEHLTPELATVYLERNTRNRKPKKGGVRNIVQNITDGDWVFNGSTIVFDCDGNMTDGQHRCIGVAQSGIAVPITVMYGVEPERAQDVTDQVINRSLADQLALHGYPNSHELASVLKFLNDVEELGEWPSSQRNKVNALKALRMLKQRPHLPEVITQAKPVSVASGVTRSVVGVYMLLFSEVDADDADAFWSAVSTGANLHDRHPVLALRRRASARLEERMPTVVMAALTVKAWVAFRQGADVAQLKWRRGGATPEPFPDWRVGVTS